MRQIIYTHMIELYLFTAIAGLGVMLNNKRQAAQDLSPSNIGPRLGPRPSVSAGSQPSMTNVYHADHARRVALQEKAAAQRAFEAAKNPKLTGVIPRTAGLNPITRSHSDHHPSRQSTQPTMIESPLTGMQIPVEHFTHNNMTPFFGSRVTQNMNHDTASMNLDRLNGGVNRLAKPKREIAPMFEPMKDIGNVNGMTGQVDMMRDRVPVSRMRNNEFPIEQQRVGPGIGNYGTEPEDVYLKARKYILPKTVDELRAGSNPKSTGYEGRVVAGQEGYAPGQFSKFGKNRPNTTVKRTKDDNFVTTGAFLKPKRRPDVIEAKATTRPHTHVHYTGAARLAQGGKQTVRAKPSHEPFRQRLAGPQFQPSKLTHQGKGAEYDHGKGSIMVYANERDVTGTRTHRGNVTSIVKAIVAPIQDAVRVAKKEFMVEAPENTVGVRPQIPSKPTTYDPDAPLRTTTKETTLTDTHGMGAIKGTALKSVVYDPDAVARTTIRETTTDAIKHGSGTIKGGALKSVVYDPDSIARTTTKETTLGEAPRTNVRRSAQKGVVYDPEDTARTTTKETTLSEAPRTNVRRTAQRGVAYDPEDTARTTTKETTTGEAPRVNIRPVSRKGIVYDPDNVARTTTKETTTREAPRTNVRRTAKKGVAYDPDAIARTTTKETTLSEAPRTNMRRVAQKGVAYDPEAVARTTTKETTHADGRPYSMIDSKTRRPSYREPGDRAKTTTKETLEDKIAGQRPRNVKGGKLAGTVKDPNDRAKTTTKETTLQPSRKGNVERLEGQKGGYLATKYHAPHTQKETLHGEYTGSANTGSVEGGGGGGYKVAEPFVKDTQKHVTSQRDYYGTAADVGPKAPPSYEDVMNAMMNETREMVLERRDPTQTSTKMAAGAEAMNVRGPGNELPNDSEERFQGKLGRKVVVVPEDQDKNREAHVRSTVTRERNMYDDTNRLDVTTLSALKSNPFTIKPLFEGGGADNDYTYEEGGDDDDGREGGDEQGGLQTYEEDEPQRFFDEDNDDEYKQHLREAAMMDEP
jgi:hypothetical protein